MPPSTDRSGLDAHTIVGMEHLDPVADSGVSVSFDDVVRHRGELLVHCYRMLGSTSDAEDVLQEVMTAAWRGVPDFAGRSSLRTWLYRIATNRSLNARRARTRRPETTQLPFHPPMPTSHDSTWWLEPLPDDDLATVTDPADEATLHADVALGFVAALQALPGRQAAALLLHDVVGFDRSEVAALLDTTTTGVKGLLQRARRAVPAGPVPIPRGVEEELVDRFVDALRTGDVDALVALLTSDAVLTMPPLELVYEGAPAITAFLRASLGWLPSRRVEVRQVRCNGAPAFVHTIDGGDIRSTGLVVLEVTDVGISRITRFLAPHVVETATQCLPTPLNSEHRRAAAATRSRCSDTPPS